MIGSYESGTLLRHLPGILQSSTALVELLGVLETLLLRNADDDATPALGDRIAAIPALFSPLPSDAIVSEFGDVVAAGDTPAHGVAAPDEFLRWLAAWVGLSGRMVNMLADDVVPRGRDDDHREWRTATLRRVIAAIVPLYTMRGTAAYLREMLKLLLPAVEKVDIDDTDLPGMRLSISELGRNSWLVSHRPFHFRISIRFAKVGGDEGGRKHHERTLRRNAIEIVELSKPAHTTYDASWEFA